MNDITSSPKKDGGVFVLSNGIYFPISNASDGPVFCRVTYEALAELDGRDPEMQPDEALEIFKRHRAIIESEATELLARGLQAVVVTPALFARRTDPPDFDAGHNTSSG